ncbi:hypothetical protein ACJZ2D_001419 [Fusarium nematophilum]
MRLLHTKRLELDSFFGRDKPRYAILSHTWGDGEVLFEDLQPSSGRDWKTKAGASKVLGSVARARSDGYMYIWIDTCCIDKSSSAELSEAINSMYAWYQHSAICYAYLADIPEPDVSLLSESRWFTRGWTLQELIAPNEAIFFTSEWDVLGRRSWLAETISTITGIDTGVLGLWKSRLDAYPVGQRMTWAAGRTTTRTEDLAYCLLGLFGINMPLLYGEGDKAFWRLQEEILRQSTTKDHSILLHNESGRIFASDPSSFSIGCKLHPWTLPTDIALVEDGVRLKLHVFDVKLPVGTTRSRDITLGILDCRVDEGLGHFARPALVLEAANNGYYRHRSTGLKIIRPGSDGETADIPDTNKPRPPARPVDIAFPKTGFDLSKAERKSVTLRHFGAIDNTFEQHRLLQLRLRPISQPISSEQYEFGARNASMRKSIFYLYVANSHILTVYAAILLNCPRKSHGQPLLLLVGFLSGTHSQPVAAWTRIISSHAILAEELKSQVRVDLDDSAERKVSGQYLEPLLQRLYNSGSELFPAPTGQHDSAKHSCVTLSGDTVRTRLHAVDFFGDTIYELQVTVEPPPSDSAGEKRDGRLQWPRRRTGQSPK